MLIGGRHPPSEADGFPCPGSEGETGPVQDPDDFGRPWTSGHAPDSIRRWRMAARDRSVVVYPSPMPIPPPKTPVPTGDDPRSRQIRETLSTYAAPPATGPRRTRRVQGAPAESSPRRRSTPCSSSPAGPRASRGWPGSERAPARSRGHGGWVLVWGPRLRASPSRRSASAPAGPELGRDLLPWDEHPGFREGTRDALRAGPAVWWPTPRPCRSPPQGRPGRAIDGAAGVSPGPKTGREAEIPIRPGARCDPCRVRRHRARDEVLRGRLPLRPAEPG